MKVLVCVKQVPGSERLKLNAQGDWIDEEGVTFAINEYDLYALEEALRLKDQRGAEVVVITEGPERCSVDLRKCLGMGADRALHLIDPAFAGSDPFVRANVIHQAIAGDPPDLILTGMMADDDNHGITGGLLASRLGWPYATGVVKLELLEGDRGLRVERELEAGELEVLELPLPAVLTIQTGINEPRYASLKGIMAAKKKTIELRDRASLGLEPGQVGPIGSRLEILKVYVPPKAARAEIVRGQPGEVAAQLIQRIREKTGLL
jgi:electron transfer flavoprotein beta subunit